MPAMKPSALKRKPLPLAEQPPLPIHARLLTAENSYVRFYTLGDCTVLVTREFGRYHLSIAHPKRYPAWEEISEAWYRVVPGAAERVGALILPPLSRYLNVHEFCMQVHEIPGEEFR